MTQEEYEQVVTELLTFTIEDLKQAVASYRGRYDY